MVRGLDYYSHTVFEWVTDKLGAQDAVCAGGRYDDLLTQLNGKAKFKGSAIGFAMGIERLIALCEDANTLPEPSAPDVCIVAVGGIGANKGVDAV